MLSITAIVTMHPATRCQALLRRAALGSFGATLGLLLLLGCLAPLTHRSLPFDLAYVLTIIGLVAVALFTLKWLVDDSELPGSAREAIAHLTRDGLSLCTFMRALLSGPGLVLITIGELVCALDSRVDRACGRLMARCRATKICRD